MSEDELGRLNLPVTQRLDRHPTCLFLGGEGHAKINELDSEGLARVVGQQYIVWLQVRVNDI